MSAGGLLEVEGPAGCFLAQPVGEMDDVVLTTGQVVLELEELNAVVLKRNVDKGVHFLVLKDSKESLVPDRVPKPVTNMSGESGVKRLESVRGLGGLLWGNVLRPASFGLRAVLTVAAAAGDELSPLVDALVVKFCHAQTVLVKVPFEVETVAHSVAGPFLSVG